MNNLENLVKNLTGKNEAEAQKAADYLMNNADINMFSVLVQKTDYLFDFVKNNVIKRIDNAVNKHNYKNIIKFFDVYSPFYDDVFCNILAKHANQDLTDEIFIMLENGTISQKTYAAKYFYYIPDTVALEILSKYAFSDDENLSYNSAQALGQMQDEVSYDIALSLLESSDDFDKLKAVKFFTAYSNDFPLKDIFKAMNSSKMPENIAGQIPYSESLLRLLSSEFKLDTLKTIDYILSGLGEILSLSDIFQFELFDVFEQLIDENYSDNEFSGKISQILLSAKLKFKEFSENQEYIFDEDKETKNEIFDISKLLESQSDEFWNAQKKYVITELDKTNDRILSAISVIKDFNIYNSVSALKSLLNCDNEIIVCEAVNALCCLNAKNEINFDEILLKIKNENIKAIIQNLI